MKGFLQCNMMVKDINRAIFAPPGDEEDVLPIAVDCIFLSSMIGSPADADPLAIM
jgi:hypothetical protein